MKKKPHTLTVILVRALSRRPRHNGPRTPDPLRRRLLAAGVEDFNTPAPLRARPIRERV